MQPKPARSYLLQFTHAQLRPLDGGATITQKDLETFGSLRSGRPGDGAKEHLNRAIGPTVVGMPDDIRQRFVDSACDRAAIRRRKSKRFRQSFHGPAHRAEQTGIARQLQPQQQAAAQVPVAPLRFASPCSMKDFHMNLNFAAGFCSPTERSHRTPWSFPSLQILQNPQRRPPSAKINCALETLCEKASKARCGEAASGSHGEQMRNVGRSQAWAEFCIAYCKRLGLPLAIPAIKIGCSDRALRFMVVGGNGPDRFLPKWAAEAALAGGFSAPLFHSEKVA
jgi:hypothetical protein